ncbi:MAG: hypothetical protein R3D33_13860 [Hyphomicrobiaceae bacterium]
MRWVTAVGGVILGAMLSANALAFQETTVGGAPAETGSATAAQIAPSDDVVVPDTVDGISLSTPDEAEAGRKVGTEVRIPGLGSLGVLPKLDFGLELLYGPQDRSSVDPESSPEDLTVRGSLSHTF